MSNKFTPLQIVERYHKRYLEFEEAFNNEPFTENKLQEDLKKLVESEIDFDSPEFEETVAELMVEKPSRRADVNNAALKFFFYAEFFLATQEEDLPENIKKDFDNLPIAEQLKPFHSIKDGKFVKNEDAPVDIQKDKLKEIYRVIKEQNK